MTQNKQLGCSHTSELRQISGSVIDVFDKLSQLQATYKRLETMQEEQARMASNASNSILNNLKHGELDGLDRLKFDELVDDDEDSNTGSSRRRLREIDVDAASIESLTGNLSDLSLKSRDIAIASEILSSLDFPQRPVRHNNIAEAHSRTFEWALKRNRLTEDGAGLRKGNGDLRRWLESGEEMFWISGKPGSGKSTFMKFITSHPDTHLLLQSWASPQTLVVASHYFWSIGSPMQRSQQGLWQSLLFSILSKAPHLISSVFQKRWSRTRSPAQPQDPWSIGELRECFSQLGRLSCGGTKFCVFVDGLDEFEGDQLDIAESFFEISRSHAIKLCISSRPWNVFEATLGRSPGSKIYIHELTMHDILEFTKSQLSRHPYWGDIDEEGAESLIQDITTQAQGVFLWVFLVTKLLREGLTNSDTLGDLQKILKAIPRDLERFFKQILESVSHVYYPKMAGFLEITIKSKWPNDAVIYFFHEMEYDDVDFALEASVCTWGSNDAKAASVRVAKRLDAFCKGLLEVDASGCVQFIHRTVADWLKTTSMCSYLEGHLPTDFDAHLAIIRAELARYKHSPPGTEVTVEEPRLINWTGQGWERLEYGLSLTQDYSGLEIGFNFLTAVNLIYDEYSRASVELFRDHIVKLNPPWHDDACRYEADLLVRIRSLLLSNWKSWRYLVYKVEADPNFLQGVAEYPPILRFPDRYTVPAEMACMGHQLANSLLGLHLRSTITDALVYGPLSCSRCKFIRESYDVRFYLLEQGADGSCLVSTATNEGETPSIIPVWLAWAILAFNLDDLNRHPQFLQTLDRLLETAGQGNTDMRSLNTEMAEQLLCAQIRALKGRTSNEVFRFHFLSNVLRKVLEFAVREQIEFSWTRLRSELVAGFPQHLASAFDMTLPTDQQDCLKEREVFCTLGQISSMAPENVLEQKYEIFKGEDSVFKQEGLDSEEDYGVLEEERDPNEDKFPSLSYFLEDIERRSQRSSRKRALSSGSECEPSQRVQR